MHPEGSTPRRGALAKTAASPRGTSLSGLRGRNRIGRPVAQPRGPFRTRTSPIWGRHLLAKWKKRSPEGPWPRTGRARTHTTLEGRAASPTKGRATTEPLIVRRFSLMRRRLWATCGTSASEMARQTGCAASRARARLSPRRPSPGRSRGMGSAATRRCLAPSLGGARSGARNAYCDPRRSPEVSRRA